MDARVKVFPLVCNSQGGQTEVALGNVGGAVIAQASLRLQSNASFGGHSEAVDEK